MVASRYPKWVLMVCGAAVLFLAISTIAELAARAAGFGPFNAEGPRVMVQPAGNFFQTDSVLGYKNRPGKFIIKTINPGHDQFDTLVFAAEHDHMGRRFVPGAPNDSLAECWIFGCSFTYGWGVNDDETFVARLQQVEPLVLFRNWGVGGYGNYQNLLQLKSAVEIFPAPDKVWLMYADFHDERNVLTEHFRSMLSRFNELGPMSVPYVRLNEDDGLKSMVSEELNYQPYLLSRYSAFVHSMQMAADKQKDQELNEEKASQLLMKEFQEVCGKRNIEFLVAYIGNPESAARVRKYCDSASIPFIDISMDLERPGASLLPIDPHPSASTHLQYARQLREALR